MLLLLYVEAANMRPMDATYDTPEQSVRQSIPALQHAPNKRWEVSKEYMHSLSGMNKFLMKMLFLRIPAKFNEK